MAQVTDNPELMDLPFIMMLNSSCINISALMSNLLCEQVNRWIWRIYCIMLLSGNLSWYSRSVARRFKTCFRIFFRSIN